MSQGTSVTPWFVFLFRLTISDAGTRSPSCKSKESEGWPRKRCFEDQNRAVTVTCGVRNREWQCQISLKHGNHGDCVAQREHGVSPVLTEGQSLQGSLIHWKVYTYTHIDTHTSCLQHVHKRKTVKMWILRIQRCEHSYTTFRLNFEENICSGYSGY